MKLTQDVDKRFLNKLHCLYKHGNENDLKLPKYKIHNNFRDLKLTNKKKFKPSIQYEMKELLFRFPIDMQK